jgi:hypothetical protein
MPDLLCGGDPHKSEGTAGRWLHVPLYPASRLPLPSFLFPIFASLKFYDP